MSDDVRVPRAPEGLPDAQHGRGALPLRYEDVTQDGRVGLRPMTHAIGASVWRDSLDRSDDARRLIAQGVVPILSRLMVEGFGGPVSVREPLRCEGCFALSRSVDDAGETRFRLDMWAGLEGPRARTWGPPPEGAGEPVAVGAVYAEHVLTRLFAPKEARKVTSLEGVSLPVREGRWAAPEGRLALPEGAEPLDAGFVQDEAETVFGLGHTDSNQHVNSLVYPALLEDAALRRRDALGVRGPAYARFAELRFRKPFFAGERAALRLRAYRRGEVFGVLAAFVPAAAADVDPGPRAHAYACLELAP